ncbi:polysaccharide biosynthesis protein [Cyanobacterium aponinum]|nr:nucleoside-diphosphate sugar epimerase/dehydratase [Cyanobacterium aponinum]
MTSIKMFTNAILRYSPKYNDISRSHRRLILFCLDTIVCILSLLFALSNFYGISQGIFLSSRFLPLLLIYIAIKLLFLGLSGLYRSVVRYTDLGLVSTITKSVILSSLFGILLIFLFASEYIAESVIVVDGLTTIIGLLLLRFTVYSLIKSLNSYYEINQERKEKLVIYGAGSAGYQLSKSLEYQAEYELIAFVDDNPELEGRIISGVPIYRPRYLFNLIRQQPIDSIIFAIPNLTTLRKREIIEGLQSLPVKFKTIPNMKDLISQGGSPPQLGNIDVKSLLGREEINPKQNLLGLNITNKVVLVTGAGGSIGSELCRQIIQLQPQALILFELSEFALYTIDLELKATDFDVPIYTYLGTITDELYFKTILLKHQVDTIYHAAAYKHVPLVEINPCVGIYNNVFGTFVTAQSAVHCRVKNYVLISTDKAVRPTNIMGASKRVAELIIQAFAARESTKTIMTMVRFGNVLGSSGSVVPRFRKQISEGKPITLTHRDITRYFISIPEAVSLVIQAGAMAKGGEIYLLDMGKPVKIYDLAVKMIKLSGMIPEKDIPIQIVGLRPGEKLYEELLIDTDKSSPTQHPQIFSGSEPMMEWETLKPHLDNLLSFAQEGNCEEVVRLLKILVPEYQPQREKEKLKLLN